MNVVIVYFIAFAWIYVAQTVQLKTASTKPLLM